MKVKVHPRLEGATIFAGVFKEEKNKQKDKKEYDVRRVRVRIPRKIIVLLGATNKIHQSEKKIALGLGRVKVY